MKNLSAPVVLFVLFQVAPFAQAPEPRIGVKEIFRNDDVAFRQIDGEIIDPGGRTFDVVFTPGRTPGSATFIDRSAGYGFSGDSFGSGNLLLSGTFSTLLATCEKTSALMQKYGTACIYPGHYFGSAATTYR